MISAFAGTAAFFLGCVSIFSIIQTKGREGTGQELCAIGWFLLAAFIFRTGI